MNQIRQIKEEFIFKDSIIISQTDLNGLITYVNKKFCQVSGYNRDELIGKPHSIVRHPKMPKSVFKKIWSTISSGHAWNGIIKNMRKDGRYYWVDTEILPICNTNDEPTGYIASTKAASRKDIEETNMIYSRMREDEN